MIRVERRNFDLLYDLQNQRRRSLERVQASIAELEIVLKGSKGSPHEYLLKGLLKTLRRNELTLAAGIIPRRAREN
jgi:hypothetical protein